MQAGASGKATLSLVLAILSIVCCGFLTGIPAIFVARSELGAIERGESSPAGKGIAQAAFWIGLIMSILSCLGTIAYVVFIAVMASSGGAFNKPF
jgi:hypothetical protein